MVEKAGCFGTDLAVCFEEGRLVSRPGQAGDPDGVVLAEDEAVDAVPEFAGEGEEQAGAAFGLRCGGWLLGVVQFVQCADLVQSIISVFVILDQDHLRFGVGYCTADTSVHLVLLGDSSALLRAAISRIALAGPRRSRLCSGGNSGRPS